MPTTQQPRTLIAAALLIATGAVVWAWWTWNAVPDLEVGRLPVPVPVESPTLDGATPTTTPPASPTADFTSPAIESFLPLFDAISAKGFVPTLRRGSTGIGYTLETMLDIEENNSPGGDFMGMELKAFRDDDLAMNDSEKMNLFLKEPKWIDGLKSADRIRKYGYTDPKGRLALYSTVTIRQSSHGFAFRIAEDGQRLWMQFEGDDVAYWTRAILEKRLLEKHSETVFVSAHARGTGKKEQFHYYGVTWCRDPAVDAFFQQIEEGAVMLELRMHLKETGAVRNHGSAFRIKQNRIPDLYRLTEQVRP